MRLRPWALLSVVLAGTLVTRAEGPRQAPATTDDEKSLRASIAAFALAFNKGDSKALAALFTDDGEALDAEGNAIQGRANLEQHYAGRLAANPGDRLETTLGSISFLAPGVARETGATRVVPANGDPAESGRYSAIHVKRDGAWLIASVREIPSLELGSHEHLKELEWLVGDWVEETDQAVVLTSVAWVDDKNYLLRTFDVRVKGKPALTGSQRIGWDPLTKQIKSWVFDSRGSYGDGLWTRSGNQWLVKASGVRADGRTTSATQILTYVNHDTMRWKSIDRTVGDQISEDIDEIVMVRRPPQPR